VVRLTAKSMAALFEMMRDLNSRFLAAHAFLLSETHTDMSPEVCTILHRFDDIFALFITITDGSQTELKPLLGPIEALRAQVDKVSGKKVEALSEDRSK
jgi:hypothetical protein